MSTPLRRRFHLGLDYGTSAAKMVVRDYGAAGGDEAHVVLGPGGQFRFPSGVAVGGGYAWFGLSPNDLTTLGLNREMTLYESVKVRCAVELAPRAAALHLRKIAPPVERLTWVDLAALTIWWLVSESSRFANTLLLPGEQPVLGMTMGAPTSFLQNARLAAGFVRIARTGWRLFKRNGPLGYPFLTLKQAQDAIASVGISGDPESTTGPDVRSWVRSEAEGALWWAFRSPSVDDGPFIEVDVGAGTTHVSLFRIVSKYLEGRWVKSKICFFSSVASTDGMDAIDVALARRSGVDPVSLRGRESGAAKELGDEAGAVCAEPIERVCVTVRRARADADPKIGYRAERTAWSNSCKALVLGGGATFEPLQEQVLGGMPRLRLEAPADLRLGPKAASDQDLRFLLSAYGLSVLGLAIPDVDEAEPIVEPPAPQPRVRREWDDTYAK